jgi:hypothetical protein
MSVVAQVVVALLGGAVGAVALDYGYHRLLHVPFRRGPLRQLYLHHLAHHRFPADLAILSFRPVRRVIDGILAAATVALVALLAAAGMETRAATLLACVALLPAVVYNHTYDALHRWVHEGADDGIGRHAWPRRIRAHHLAGTGVMGEVHGRGGLSLVFPFV